MTTYKLGLTGRELAEKLALLDELADKLTEREDDIGDIATALANIIAQTEAILGGN